IVEPAMSSLTEAREAVDSFAGGGDGGGRATFRVRWSGL
ncbi:hypothetical protein A2U01_0069701, partial [Trifolium medium]|nr:hypothetical protein [Trifolium medium]